MNFDKMEPEVACRRDQRRERDRKRRGWNSEGVWGLTEFTVEKGVMFGREMRFHGCGSS